MKHFSMSDGLGIMIIYLERSISNMKWFFKKSSHSILRDFIIEERFNFIV